MVGWLGVAQVGPARIADGGVPGPLSAETPEELRLCVPSHIEGQSVRHRCHGRRLTH